MFNMGPVWGLPWSEPFMTKCLICGARIDTREADEGGVDIDFFQIEEGKFVCSETCLDQHDNDNAETYL